VEGDYLRAAPFAFEIPLFLVFGGAILALNSRRPRIEIPARGVGLVVVLGLLALTVYAGINFFTAILPGQPEATGGRYYLNNHGSRTEIDREQYLQAVRLQTRLATGHEMAFLGVGSALLLASIAVPPAGTAARPAVVLDMAERRLEATPRARIYLGAFGVISALVVGYWLISSELQRGGTATLFIVFVLAITVFNIVRYWRWVAGGRSERP
jgi:hypothetical protein